MGKKKLTRGQVRYYNFMAKGLCPRCGKEEPVPGYVYGDKCQEYCRLQYHRNQAILAMDRGVRYVVGVQR